MVWRPVSIHNFRLTWLIVEIFLYRFPDMEFSLETRLCPISCKFSKTDFSSTESGLLRPNWSRNLQKARQNSFWLQRTNICVFRRNHDFAFRLWFCTVLSSRSLIPASFKMLVRSNKNEFWRSVCRFPDQFGLKRPDSVEEKSSFGQKLHIWKSM